MSPEITDLFYLDIKESQTDSRGNTKTFAKPETHQSAGFSLGRLHRGDSWEETQTLWGGGANFDRLYHKLKVLLMLSCNYTMQFIGYNSIKTHWFISYRFQIHTVMQHQYKRIGAINLIM